MSTHFLKFANKEQAIESGLLVADSQDGEIIKQTANYFIDVVGEIPKTTIDGIDGEGKPIYSTVILDGFHVNVAIDELPPELLPYKISVNTPYRSCAGVESA